MRAVLLFPISSKAFLSPTFLEPKRVQVFANITFWRENPPHLELPFPPAESLNQNFILGEIRDYIRELREFFPNVDMDILLEQIKQVKAKNVHPEVQIRQFLQAFKNAPAFRDAFDLLDEDTKKKVVAFREGTSCDKIIGSKGFQLPLSPPAKHHFRLLDAIHSFFHPHDVKEGQPEEATALSKTAEAKSDEAQAPKIYEDQDRKKIMKVWKDLSMLEIKDD